MDWTTGCETPADSDRARESQDNVRVLKPFPNVLSIRSSLCRRLAVSKKQLLDERVHSDFSPGLVSLLIRYAKLGSGLTHNSTCSILWEIDQTNIMSGRAPVRRSGRRTAVSKSRETLRDKYVPAEWIPPEGQWESDIASVDGCDYNGGNLVVYVC